MPDFDVTLPVTLTFRVEAADAEKAEWALRHAFDSRHAGDPMAGLSVPVRHVESAAVMVCSFDALDRESVIVEGFSDNAAASRPAPDLVALLTRAARTIKSGLNRFSIDHPG